MWNRLSKLRQKYLSLNLHEVIDYEKFCMISIVWNSSKIEGCTLTELDTKVLIEKDITAAGKPLADHLMVKDHYEAFLFIKEQAKLKRKMSIPFLQEINALVMKNTGGIVRTIMGDFDSSKGDLRLVQVYVDRKYFPHYQKVPRLLNQFCEGINKRLDAVEGDGSQVLQLAADAHYNFVNIHPFADGNGRTSRMLMNYIQLYHQEPLVKIFTEDRAPYIEALNKTEEQEDLGVFRNFICQQQTKFYQLEIEKYRKMDVKGFKLLL